jgi:hypothetical protein
MSDQDNVDTPQVEEVVEEVEEKDQPAASYGDIREAKNYVVSKTGVKNIMCMLNYQITDGSVVEFVDVDKSLVVAAGRLSYNNKLLVNDSTGEMFVPVNVNGLSLTRSTISFK